jgi:phytoene synthase
MTPAAPPFAIDDGNPHAAERALALGYTPVRWRPALDALFLLDRRLGDIVRSTREPIVGQMRLTWWHDALGRLDAGAPAPAEPVLTALADAVLPHGVDGGELAVMIDGWEALLDGSPTDAATLTDHARARGATLFTLAGRLVGAGGEPLAAAGEGWALADLAANLSDPAATALARLLAAARLDAIVRTRWSRPVRGLGALALLAQMDVAAEPRAPGHPARIGRLLVHRLTGR